MAFLRRWRQATEQEPNGETEHTYRDIIHRIGRSKAPLLAFHGLVVPSKADPYANWDEIRTAAMVAKVGGEPFKVHDNAHNHLLWSDADNYAFRVHHEAMHVLHDSPAFEVDGEAYVWLHTCEDLGYTPTGVPGLVLFGEIVGQAKYYDKTGQFPVVNGKQPAITDPHALFYHARNVVQQIRDKGAAA